MPGTIARMASKPADKKTAATPLKKKSTARKKAVGAVVSAGKTLTPIEKRFIEEYLIDLNGMQAYMRASKNTSEAAAAVSASRLLIKANVAAALSKAQAERSARTNMTADAALREVWSIAIADAREIVQVKVGCCRHCHGEGHKRQRTIAEMNRDREKHAEAGKSLADFEEEGGIGFNPLLQPVAHCPECGGDGQARTVLMDTRHLSPQAAALYAGAKQGKHGIEVQMHDKLAAMEKVFKHLGLYKEDNNQKVDPLTALLHTIAGGNNSGFKPVQDDPEHV